MNTNYEVVKNLIGLLVKKSGFNLDNNYSELELDKVKKNIKELQDEREGSNNKKVLTKMIEDLKVRQANWENNAEIVGRSLLDAYKEGKTYQSVKMRIELLGNLASKNNISSLSNIYDKISNLENEYTKLTNKINSNSYESVEEKEMDKRYKNYLVEKINSVELELKNIESTLDELRTNEKNDVNIVNKVKEYINKLENDLEKINSVLDNTLVSYIAYESFENIEKANNKTIEKIDKFKDILSRTEKVLEEVRNTRIKTNERKTYLEKEKETYNNKLNKVSIKLEENDYINNIEKMEDINKKELIRLDIDSLNNIKDVIYIDVNKVKEELIKEWSKVESEKVLEEDNSLEKTNKPIIEETKINEPIIEETEVQLEEEQEIIEDNTDEIKTIEKEEKKNKIELDW